MKPLEAPPANDARDTGETKPADASLMPKLTMGVGALAIIGGGVLLAFNQGPVVAPYGTEQPQHYRDTVIPGIGLMIGGAAVGLGGYFWWRHTRAQVAPSVVPLPGGATVGVAGSF